MDRQVKEALVQKAEEVSVSPEAWNRQRSMLLASLAMPGGRSGFLGRLRAGSILEAVTAVARFVALVVTKAVHPDLRSTPGGDPAPHAMQGGDPVPTEAFSSALADLRQRASFPLFAPTFLPAGLTPEQPVGEGEPIEKVRLIYRSADGEIGLLVLNGPAGCCLDADMPRKKGQEIPVREGVPGHFLVNQPEFGGHILWWNEAGSYVAISGPHLAKEDLTGIAAAMSAGPFISGDMQAIRAIHRWAEEQNPTAGAFLRNFPARPGKQAGRIGVGGPPPGDPNEPTANTGPVTFETVVERLGSGDYLVRFIQTYLATDPQVATWSFTVTREGVVIDGGLEGHAPQFTGG